MNRPTISLALLAAMLFPALAFAQDSGAADAGGGTPLLLWIIAALGVVTAILNGVSNILPGAGTYAGIALTVIASVTVALQDLAATDPGASVSVILVTAVSAAIGRARSGARAAA